MWLEPPANTLSVTPSMSRGRAKRLGQRPCGPPPTGCAGWLRSLLTRDMGRRRKGKGRVGEEEEEGREGEEGEEGRRGGGGGGGGGEGEDLHGRRTLGLAGVPGTRSLNVVWAAVS